MHIDHEFFHSTLKVIKENFICINFFFICSQINFIFDQRWDARECKDGWGITEMEKRSKSL